jgi:ankyrin repeat protein
MSRIIRNQFTSLFWCLYNEKPFSIVCFSCLLALNTGILSLFLFMGCDKDVQQKHAAKDLRTAIRSDDEELVSIIHRQGAPIDGIEGDGFPAPLHIAIGKGNISMVKSLISHGADLECRSSLWGLTPLHMALQSGNRDIAWLLYESGADISARDEMGASVIHHAAGGGDIDFMEEMLKKGFDVQTTDGSMATPLIYACIHGKLEAVRYLLENGASINPASGRIAPIMAAITLGKEDSLEIVKLLQKAGTNPNTVYGKKGNTALKLAALVGNEEVFAHLLAVSDYDFSKREWKDLMERVDKEGFKEIAGLLKRRISEATARNNK